MYARCCGDMPCRNALPNVAAKRLPALRFAGVSLSMASGRAPQPKRRRIHHRHHKATNSFWVRRNSPTLAWRPSTSSTRKTPARSTPKTGPRLWRRRLWLRRWRPCSTPVAALAAADVVASSLGAASAVAGAVGAAVATIPAGYGIQLGAGSTPAGRSLNLQVTYLLSRPSNLHRQQRLR